MIEQNIFSALRVKQIPEEHKLPPFFRKHFDLIMKAHAFQCDKLRGDIDFAEFFGAVAESTLMDSEFAAICPEYASHSSFEAKQRKKRRKVKTKK